MVFKFYVIMYRFQSKLIVQEVFLIAYLRTRIPIIIGTHILYLSGWEFFECEILGKMPCGCAGKTDKLIKEDKYRQYGRKKNKF